MEQKNMLNQIINANCAEELDRENILACLNSDDFIIRCDTVQAIAKYVNISDIQELIISKLYDRNYLVRCEACEALEKANSASVIYELCDCILRERSSTVRMYIVSAIIVLIKRLRCSEETIKMLKSTYKKEKQERVIIAYLVLFYLLENDIKYVSKALELSNPGLITPLVRTMETAVPI